MENMPNRREVLKGLAGIAAVPLTASNAEAASGKEDALRELREEITKLQTLRDQYIEAQKNEDHDEQQRLDGEIANTVKKITALDEQLGPK